MSLIKPIVPGDIVRAFTVGLGDFISYGSPLWSLLLNKYVAIQAYTLNLEPFCTIISTSEDPSSIVMSYRTLPDNLFRSSGWRFLAAEGDLYGGAHVGSITPTQPPKLTGFSTAAQVLTAIESFNELPTISLPEPGNFEISVLRITWLHFEAWWLHWLPITSNGSLTNSVPAKPPASPERPGSAPPATGAIIPDQGTDVIVPYIGFVQNASGGQLSPLNAYILPDFLVAILGRAQTVCAQSLRRQVSVQRAQALRAREQAKAQRSSLTALESQATALDQQAETAKDRAAKLGLRKK